MLITMENATGLRLHGITILDEASEPMKRVQEFDTETMEARVGRVGTELETRVVSDYVIFYNDLEHEAWLRKNLPEAAMLEHLQPAGAED